MRFRGVRQAADSWRSLRRAMFAGGGSRPDPAVPCSLLQPTGSELRMAVVKLEPVRLAAAAHRNRATTNDAILVAVGAALQQMLLSRGEWVDPIAITVPVSGRRLRPGPVVGSLVSPMLVDVPTIGAVGERLAQVEAILGGLFRVVARLGGYRYYLNHQRRFHAGDACPRPR
jgi:diacylglycerol O-acyltransferase / wax synthase